MGDRKLTLKQRYRIIERKLFDKIKGAFIDDSAPLRSVEGLEKSPTIQEIKKLGKRYSVSGLLPYECYDRDTGLYFNYDTVGFMLAGLPATSLDSTTLKSLNGLFSRYHKSDTNIQISLYADPNVQDKMEAWKNYNTLDDSHPFKETLSKLDEKRVEYLDHGRWESLFSDEAVLYRDFKIIVSYTLMMPEGMSSVEISKEDVDFLMRTRSSLKSILTGASIHTHNMEPDEFINLMDGLISPSKNRGLPQKYNEDEPINRQCVDPDTVYHWGSGTSSVSHKDEVYSIVPFHVRQFPQIWAGYQSSELIGSFLENVARISCPFLLTLTVHVPNQISEKGAIKKKSVRATQMLESPTGKYVPAWKDRKRDWDFAEKNLKGDNKMLEAFFQILLFTPTGKESECEESLKTTYERIGWKITRSRFTPVHSFLGALPMGIDRDTRDALKIFGHYSKRLSWTCTNIAPWIGEFKGSKSPLLMLAGKRGQLNYFNPYDNEDGNFNIACCAASGSGKSFFTNEWIKRILGVSGKVFVIDSGHSYRELSELLGGTYIDFGKFKPIFNPFSEIDPDDPEMFKDQLPLLKTLFESMASPMKKLDQVCLTDLEKAIKAAWENKKNDCDIDEVVRELGKIKDQHGNISETAEMLMNSLYSYSSDGVYGEHFIGRSNIDLSNDFVAMDLQDLEEKPDLQSVFLLVLMMKITQEMYKAKDKSRKKLCIIDEAWSLLNEGNFGKFIGKGFRVARKHGGSFMTITQKISDYHESSTTKACLMNSDFVIYLRMKAEDLNDAESNNYINNNNGLIDILRNIRRKGQDYSELVIVGPDGLSVNRFIVDPVTAKLYSTKADEVEFIRRQIERGASVFDAIYMLLREQYKKAG